MSEPVDKIVPMMREENASLHRATVERLDLIERRLSPFGSTQASFKHARSADSLLTNLVTGEFEGRTKVLERGPQALERLEGRVSKVEAQR